MAQHLTWHADERGQLVDVPAAIEAYARHHRVSTRTAWTDLGRLVAVGLVLKTQTPANIAQEPAKGGHGPAQGPGSGRCAEYALTLTEADLEAVPVAPRAVDNSRRRPAQSGQTSNDASLTREGNTPLPPGRPAAVRRGRSGAKLPLEERREAAALLTGCLAGWRRQLRDEQLLRRRQADALMPLVADVLRRMDREDVLCLLTDRVKSARSLAGVLRRRLVAAIEAHPVRPVPATAPRAKVPDVSAAQRSYEAAAAESAARAAQAAINAAGRAAATAAWTKHKQQRRTAAA
jgi:hypothetical protein